ncbi:hypothetical protein [Burkholderia sp. WSM2232]|uniref:hypothetical protein n=1 Tax=Burkholderia sp. WSM2232 TaxID=944436 RepID=UPI0018DE7A90|nr:hypothetical protein [Burkholderia sp. WSM2232]
MPDAQPIKAVPIAIPLSALLNRLLGRPRKTCLGMSECPSTGINKALLKFAPQGRKNLKMYRSNVPNFLTILCGICYRKHSPAAAFLSEFAVIGRLDGRIQGRVPAGCRRSWLLTGLRKKISHSFSP